jgi:hypothetical protein
VEEADPGFRLRLAYRSGDRVVHIETRRAERTPDAYLAMDPALPEYPVDVRITDTAGSLIYARIAGDGEDFASDVAPAPADAEGAALHQEDVAVAREALASLTHAGARSLGADAFDDELRTLREVEAAFAPKAALASVEDVAQAELGVVAAAAGSYMHRVQLWKSRCCVPGGWHSATRTDAWSGTYWSAQVDRCNHGRCPGGDSMTVDCSYTSGWRSGLPRAGVCSTSYNAVSIWGHNCNDDSHLSVIDVRHGWLHSTSGGSCSDGGANPDPDGCDPSSW